MRKGNCFTVLDGKFVLGIEEKMVGHQNPSPCVVLDDGCGNTFNVGVMTGDYAPEYENGRIVLAQPNRTNHMTYRERFFAGYDGTWPGVLVRAKVVDIKVPFEPLVEGVNLLPGIEGGYFAQAGNPRSLTKDQLSWFRPDKPNNPMFLIDSRKAVGRVIMSHGAPTLVPVTKDELIWYVRLKLARAMNNRQQPGIDWATHVLRDLGCRDI